ncbi:MAG: hypothetical protein GYA24_21885 [Candidatus Lokiarchaeota archaeon]|nr:hypothetical protein [Candidatus Lokiarchaeota archaeon]
MALPDTHEQNPADGKKAIDLKFKPMAIRQDIPIDFWKKKEEEDEDGPMILEVKEAHEGEPVRGKCIVCYKPIYESEKNDLFSCPNCSREAHYLCATIFITEHQICPVCSSKLAHDNGTGKWTVVKR